MQRLQWMQGRLKQWTDSGRGKQWAQGLGYLAGGFFLTAGALDRTYQPLALGLLCASPGGLGAVLIALGAGIGYPVFWGTPGLQGAAWMLFGLGFALLLGKRGIVKRQKLLMPSLAALIVSGTGVLFQTWFGDETPIIRYLLRIGVGVITTGIFSHWRRNQSPWSRELVGAMAVLSLAQVFLGRYLGLGFVAAGYAAAAFPGGILAGLALDLARITDVKMTAVLCAAAVLVRIPRIPRPVRLLCGAVCFVPVAILSGVWDVKPLPGLILGGALAGLLPWSPEQKKRLPKTGEAAIAQVRLEQMALALRQMEQALLLTREPEPDWETVLARSCAAACDTCPERKGCRARALVPQLSRQILEQPGLGEEDLPPLCRKSGRLLSELRRGQEQLRRMKGDRNRLESYRGASRDQFGFLADFLEGLSDDLASRHEYRPARFKLEIGSSGRGSGGVNGDRCVWFSGPGEVCYVLLCDGMGTGEEAARESEEAARLLRQMLCAGFPAEYALRSLNSLAILRNFGGCATVDLLQLRLDTGKGNLYKWGASPSYLLVCGQLRKIGTAGPPPGLSHRCRETVDRLSLGRGEVLILLSDGVSEEGLLDSARTTPSQSPGEMAAAILERSSSRGDDATAVVVRLTTNRLSTQ